MENGGDIMGVQGEQMKSFGSMNASWGDLEIHVYLCSREANFQWTLKIADITNANHFQTVLDEDKFLGENNTLDAQTQQILK